MTDILLYRERASDVTEEEIMTEALRRTNEHRHHPTHAPMCNDFDEVGVRGEVYFCDRFGLPVIFKRMPRGDDGIDKFLNFEIDGRSFLQQPIDVKASRIAGKLMSPEGKVLPHVIYLLILIDRANKGKMLGWEWGYKLMKVPPRDFGKGVPTHAIDNEVLRRMWELIRFWDVGFGKRWT